MYIAIPVSQFILLPYSLVTISQDCFLHLQIFLFYQISSFCTIFSFNFTQKPCCPSLSGGNPNFKNTYLDGAKVPLSIPLSRNTCRNCSESRPVIQGCFNIITFILRSWFASSEGLLLLNWGSQSNWGKKCVKCLKYVLNKIKAELYSELWLQCASPERGPAMPWLNLLNVYTHTHKLYKKHNQLLVQLNCRANPGLSRSVGWISLCKFSSDTI